MVHRFIEPQEQGSRRWLDHGSFRMRSGKDAYGVHRIPQCLDHVLDLGAVLSSNEEESPEAGDSLELRTNLVQEMSRISIGRGSVSVCAPDSQYHGSAS